MTKSTRFCTLVKVSKIWVLSSLMEIISCTSTPILFNALAMKPELVSVICPIRISSPMVMMVAFNWMVQFLDCSIFRLLDCSIIELFDFPTIGLFDFWIVRFLDGVKLVLLEQNSLARIVAESPELKKLIFLGKKERPKEATFVA